jgi:hypothetical protein
VYLSFASVEELRFGWDRELQYLLVKCCVHRVVLVPGFEEL